MAIRFILSPLINKKSLMCDFLHSSDIKNKKIKRCHSVKLRFTEHFNRWNLIYVREWFLFPYKLHRMWFISKILCFFKFKNHPFEISDFCNK